MKKLMILIGAIAALTSCEDPFKDEPFKAFEEQTIGVYLQEQPQYALWVTMLDRANLLNAINLGSATYTCFVADNEAVEAYMTEQGTTFNEFIEDTEALEYLMRYHILVGDAINASDMLLKLPIKTASGDYLTAGVDPATEVRYIDNGEGKPRSNIVRKDAVMSNGVVQEVDCLLHPFTESIWDVISGEERYSIFADAIKAVDFVDWLSRTEVRYEETDATYRENKTLFAVPDSIYAIHGVTSLADLQGLIGGDPADENSDFYQYMLYHVMDDLNSYAELTDFPYDGNSMILYTASERRGLSILDSVNTIWFNPQEPAKRFNIIEGRRDIPTKNGYIHEINNLGEVPAAMAHYYVIWELTSDKAYRKIPFYRSEKSTGATAETYVLEKGEIPGLSWSATPANKGRVWYHSENVGDRYWNDDALYWDLGVSGELVLTTPVLPKGKYLLKSEKLNDNTTGGKYNMSLDRVTNLHTDVNFKGGATFATHGSAQTFGSEETHVIRYTTGSLQGYGGVDRIVFEPVN